MSQSAVPQALRDALNRVVRENRLLREQAERAKADPPQDETERCGYCGEPVTAAGWCDLPGQHRREP